MMRRSSLFASAVLAGGILACSGPAPVDSATVDPLGERPSNLDLYVNVSQQTTDLSPLVAGCQDPGVPGTNYLNTEIQPYVAANPKNKAHLISLHQQDRWSGFGGNGIVTRVSKDLGITWTQATRLPPFTRCMGGNASNGGDYQVATDTWVSISPSGTAFQVAFAIHRTTYAVAILVSRSKDGGLTWSDPVTLARDTDPRYFVDRPTVTADPNVPGTAYVVWDRVDDSSTETAMNYVQPTYFARTTDDGETWEPARMIYNPGLNKSTVGHQIAVLPDGTLLNGFLLVDENTTPATNFVVVLRSTDRGITWSDAIIPHTIQHNTTLHPAGFIQPDPDNGTGRVRNANIPQLVVDRSSGTVYAVWSDSRFGSGTSLGIALSSSTDGGLTWSAPIQINKSPAGVSALVPMAAVTYDGRVGVTYYDFRNNDAEPSLPTDFFLVTCKGSCTQANQWKETHVGGPFDARLTPVTGLGHMLGDYTGLTTFGHLFVSTHARTSAGDTSNATNLWHSILLP